MRMSVFVLPSPSMDRQIRTTGNSCSGSGSGSGKEKTGSTMTSLSLTPASLLTYETLTLTSMMRRNSRWASGSAVARSLARPELAGEMGLRRGTVRGKEKGGNLEREEEGVAYEALVRLREEIEGYDDLSSFTAVTLLAPFLALLTSPRTPGPLTSVVLSSLTKFLTYRLFEPTPLAVSQLVSSVTHCKFESSDSMGDEVVLAKILEVVKEIVCGPTGDFMRDEEVCAIVETGLSMCCQMRLSEMLRRMAERTMQAITAKLFERLAYMEPSDDVVIPPTNGRETPVPDPGGLRMAAPNPRGEDVLAQERVVAASNGMDEKVFKEKVMEDDASTALGDEDEFQYVFRPYGLPSISEILRVLINLLNPFDQQHTDSMRIIAMGIVNVALEVGGQHIGRFPELRVMVEDGLCKHLFQIARSDNPTMLSASLRTISAVFDTARPWLKLQQELFISFLLDRLIRPLPFTSASAAKPMLRKEDIEREFDYATWDSENAPSVLNGAVTPQSTGASNNGPVKSTERVGKDIAHGEARDLMFEVVSIFARGRSFMADLFINYDCNVDCEDLFDRLVRFLCRGVFPSHSGGHYMQDNSQLLALDTVLAFISHMGNRLDARTIAFEQSDIALPSPADLLASKGDKALLREGALRFKEKPKDGIRFLEENDMIYFDPDKTRMESLALFLKTTPGLDKKALGDYISRPDQSELLVAFLKTFDFRGKIVHDALRELLESFRLPGESQQIDRITEAFADIYFASDPVEVKSTSAVYVLAFSVIMLNTDLHNPQNIKNRMSLEDYQRNLRGVNENSDFSPQYLQTIYNEIKKREIVMPEEHHGQLGFDYAWKELLRRARTSGPYITSNSGAYDKLLFAVCWRPLVSSIGYAFTHFQDESMIQRVITGFRQCANLASRFDMPEAFDYIINTLAKISGLTQGSSIPDAFPSSTVDGQKVTISPLSIKFGTNFKAQLAAVVLFTITNTNGACIHQGWINLFEIYQTLFVHSLLPTTLLEMEEFLSGDTAIPLRPKSAAQYANDRRADSGLLSTLSSYLLSPYGAADGLGRDINDEDVENTLCSVDCIASCKVDEVYAQIFTLPQNAKVQIITALLTLLQKNTFDKLKQRTSVSTPTGRETPTPGSMPRLQLPYEPSTCFLLEILFSLSVKSEEVLVIVWSQIFDFLTRLLMTSQSLSILLTERAVVGFLKLLSVIARMPELKDQVLLGFDLLRQLPLPVINALAGQLAIGVIKLIKENPALMETATDWNLVFALLTTTINVEDGAKVSMDFTRSLLSSEKGVVEENFVGIIDMLEAFANVAGGGMAMLVNGQMSHESSYHRGQQAVELLREIQVKIPELMKSSSLPQSEAWEAFWLPLLMSTASQCVNSTRVIRQYAVTSLQRSLLAPEILENPTVDLSIVFDRVLFPTLDELLKPQVFRRDAGEGGMEETRLRFCGLLSRIFLHYLVEVEGRLGMSRLTELWSKVLEYMDRFMHSGRRDQMFEAVPESLKNVLLVMHASGYLVPPFVQERSDTQKILWDSTFARIDTFLPDLKNELFPEPPPPPPQQAPSTSPNEELSESSPEKANS